jgi:5-carboxymethyl-2-hydroxymuconate isomerase
MPHLTIEYTANILEKEYISEIFPLLHNCLKDTLSAKIENCKSKAIKLEQYFFGLERKEFIMVFLVLKRGRKSVVIENAVMQIKNILLGFFEESKTKLNLEISIEVRDLSENYCKF